MPGEALLCAHRQDDGHGSFLREEISIFKFSLCQVETDVAGRAGNLSLIPVPSALTPNAALLGMAFVETE